MKKAINIILNIILISVFLFSSYKVFMYVKGGIDNKNLMSDIGVTISESKPTNEESPLDFTKNIMNNRKEAIKALKDQNSDVVGWIYI